MKIRADFHIHSALSPCGSLDMSPTAIVRKAKSLGLDVIAVTDHNSCQNGFYAGSAGETLGIRIIFGMEAQTREDVHLLCLFEERGSAEKFDAEIYGHLPEIPNNSDFFGDQAVVDEADNIVRFEKKLLMNALDLSIPELVERVRSRGGFVIPSHVESQPFGLMPALGMVPEELQECVLEISSQSDRDQVIRFFPELERFSLVRNSDAHFLQDIGRIYSIYETDDPSLASMYRAARNGRFSVHKRT